MDPLTLLDLGSRPDAPAVIASDAAFTRAELLARAAALGRKLEPIAGGSYAIVTLDSGPGFVAALDGCWLAGVTPVLLDPLVRHELDRAIETTGARAVISGPGPLAVALPPGVIALTPNQDTHDPWDAPAIDDDAPLVLMFTSGTTGKPALVPKSFAQLDVEVRFLSGLLESPRQVATLVPWCHILGFIPSFLLPLRLGGVCDLSAGISPRSVLRRAGEGQLDLVVAVPAIYRVMIRLLAAGGLPPIAPGCRFLCSGAPLPAETRARFGELTERPIIDVYGSTEAGGVAYRTEDGPWIPQPHVDWRIAPGGHLEVRSASVSFPGEDGFYRIGDLARPAVDGFTLDGRSDDVVKIGGRRVSLGEVQQAVEGCPGVEGAAVLAAELRGELRLLAFVEPGGEAVTGDEVKTFVRSQLADHKVPRVVRVLDELPRTPAGKVDRRALARQQLKEG
ncbi:MAG: acyl--CoA ligase [Deltaproteobacteria bacterium]|nr:acyl--CoA ligase [Deltaproteobacteria bacterium]